MLMCVFESIVLGRFSYADRWFKTAYYLPLAAVKTVANVQLLY